MTRTVLALVLLVAAALPAAAPAQVGQADAALAVPDNGMTMAQVTSRFGPPEVRLPSVGEPPITRWTYPGFTVYFEYNLVLHTVIHR